MNPGFPLCTTGRRRLLPILFLLLWTVAPGTSCTAPAPSEEGEPPTAVRVVSPRWDPMRETLDYIGVVRSRREINVVARVNGTVSHLPVDEGRLAAAGDTLVRLGSPEMTYRLRRAEAEHERTGIEAGYACETFATDKALAESGALAPRQLENSRRRCSGARAAHAAATAASEEVRSLQAYSAETAPFAGMVLRHHVSTGEPALPGKPLLLYGDLDHEAVVYVSEEDIHAGITEGTPVLLSAGRLDSWTGTVRAVAPLARTGRTVEVRIPLPDKAAALHHGMSVDVEFILREESEISAVPRLALHREGDETVIYLLDGDRVIRRSVTTGVEADGWVAVSPELPPGSLVVDGGGDALTDGAAVYAVRADEVTP